MDMPELHDVPDQRHQISVSALHRLDLGRTSVDYSAICGRDQAAEGWICVLPAGHGHGHYFVKG